MSRIKDSLLKFAFCYVFFLIRPNRNKFTNLIFIIWACGFQLWCYVWTISSIIIEQPDSLSATIKTYLSGVYALIIISNCVMNIIVTTQVTFSDIAHNYATNFHSKRKIFLEVAVFVWILAEFFQNLTSFYQNIKYRQPIPRLLMMSSFNYLLLRLEMAVLYLGFRTENLSVRCDTLNNKLNLWLPLDDVVKITKKHHELLNEIQEISKIGGLTIFVFCLRCVGSILINLYSLIFIKSDEKIITWFLWFRCKYIVTYFVSNTGNNNLIYLYQFLG